MPERLLIVNADDFGFNDAATDGILAAHRAGAVTSTTMLVNTPGAARAASLAAAYPALAIGLHFNLTWGRPLAPAADVASLLDDAGTFLPREALARRCVFGRIDARHVRRELDAQHARLHELGIAPSHVDSHQHVHAMSPVFDVVAARCAELGRPMRVPWVASEQGAGLARRFRRGLLAMLLRRPVARWRGRVAWNDGIGSVFDVTADAAGVDETAYRTVLARAEGRVFELMVHPVSSADAMAGYTRIGDIAAAEGRWLAGGGLRALAAESGFRLGTYRDLAA